VAAKWQQTVTAFS